MREGVADFEPGGNDFGAELLTCLREGWSGAMGTADGDVAWTRDGHGVDCYPDLGG